MRREPGELSIGARRPTAAVFLQDEDQLSSDVNKGQSRSWHPVTRDPEAAPVVVARYPADRRRRRIYYRWCVVGRWRSVYDRRRYVDARSDVSATIPTAIGLSVAGPEQRQGCHSDSENHGEPLSAATQLPPDPATAVHTKLVGASVCFGISAPAQNRQVDHRHLSSISRLEGRARVEQEEACAGLDEIVMRRSLTVVNPQRGFTRSDVAAVASEHIAAQTLFRVWRGSKSGHTRRWVDAVLVDDRTLTVSAMVRIWIEVLAQR